MATKWGIVSAGKISHDFTVCLRSLPPAEHQVVAVAARSLSAAQDFAKRHNIAKAYGSYEELAKDASVEVVYVGTINTQHLPVAKIMLEHGKHLLVEKPLTLSLKQTKEMVDLAKAKDLFLMEAIWSRFVPSYKFMVEQISSGAIGDVVYARSEFGVPISNIERIKNKNMGGGTVLDLSVYTTNFVLMALKEGAPEEIKAIGFLNADGVDESVSATMKFSDGRKIGVVTTHSVVELSCEAEVVGTKGSIKLPKPMWAPEAVIVNGKKHEFPYPETVAPCNFLNSSGLRYEAMEVRRCLQNGLKESPVMPHKDSKIIAGIQDEFRRQLGVVFAEDNN